MTRPDEIRAEEIRKGLQELTRQALLLEGDIEKASLTFEKRMKELKNKATKLYMELDEMCDRK